MKKKEIAMPAVRGEMGDWAYYMTTFSFEDLNKLTTSIGDTLYQEFGGEKVLKSLAEAEDEDGLEENINLKMQRSKDYSHIDDIVFYLNNEEQRFFNSLVLAVFDDYPTWNELVFEYNNVNYSNDVGIISFPSEAKLIAIDGQHRLEAIKKIVEDNPEKGKEKVSAIIIAHEDSEEGIKRSRRLFTTLNKTAKPIGGKDLIILDEDNAACIITRKYYTTEEFNILSKKGVALNDTESLKSEQFFSSIITVNNIHEKILDFYLENNIELKNKFLKDRKIDNLPTREYKPRFKRSRPDKKDLDDFDCYVNTFWNEMINNIPELNYLENNIDKEIIDIKLRTNGNCSSIFRPIFQKSLVTSLLRVSKEENVDLCKVIQRLSNIDLTLNKAPWNGLIWDENTKSMITSNIQIPLNLTIRYLLSLNNEVSDNLVERYFKHNQLFSDKEEGRQEIIKMFKDLHQ